MASDNIVLLVDGEGDYYAFDAAVLDAAADVTDEQVDAARLTAESRAAVHMAFGYERVGTACGPLTAPEEIVLGRNPPRRFELLGSIGAL
jgi:hypothetical protein